MSEKQRDIEDAVTFADACLAWFDRNMDSREAYLAMAEARERYRRAAPRAKARLLGLVRLEQAMAAMVAKHGMPEATRPDPLFDEVTAALRACEGGGS
jgi:hypothetical protein